MAYTTVPKSTAYFNTKLYSGNGGTQTITGVGFQPDWTWIKNRNAGEHHVLTDVVRGANKQLRTNGNNAQGTLTTQLTAFTSDGFSVGAGSEVNNGSQTYASWNWKANGLGSSNTDGSINSIYTSASTTSGFSIVNYTGNGTAGATVGHGLGKEVKTIIIKKYNTTSDWVYGSSGMGFTKYMNLNSTSAESTYSGMFNNIAPTSSVFTLGADGQVNASGGTYIAYCFAEIPGFSKFGLYEGTGNADGPFVYTGFKPSFVMIKAKGQTESWYINDNKRPGYNTNNYYLNPNTNSAEGTSTTLATGLLSNGFKPFNSDTSMNTSGQGYVYMAFGQTLVGTNNVPATAR